MSLRLSDGRSMDVKWFKNEISHLESNCRSYTLLIVLCCIVISSALATVAGGMIYRHRWKLRYLLFMSRKRFFGYRRLPDYTLIENYRFDAFISYAEDNFRFILDEVIPTLETGNVSLCLHQRDFLPGNAISDNIIHAIQSSRKTIVILSEAFLRSKWCMYEFNMARMESIYSREDNVCLVIVMLEQVPHDKMPLEMLRWIQENSYIEYTPEQDGNIMFWENLKLAMQ
ncbi:toll-like receptor 4 [Dreissena polymorpha]|uniref:toll-like receptor 4 n=1 Tax=Dreissena polymorpha TaxID=45954 RepID=UPI0022642F13|nr:toll-like receptor 4 [Dreissena polymorpha]